MLSRTNASTLQSLLLLPLLTCTILAQSVNLSQFQQISGFPSDCTEAYNTPIPGCTSNDFIDNHACSQSCVSGLIALTRLINSACAGISTSPNTLIGLFFEGKGVQALCPGASSAPTTSQQQASTTVMVVSSTSQSPLQVTSATPSSLSTSTISSIPSVSPSATISQTTSSIQVTANPNPIQSSTGSSSSSPLPSFTLSSLPSSTSAAQGQSTSNSNSFGGSVDPFGGSASGASCLDVDKILIFGLGGATLLLGL